MYHHYGGDLNGKEKLVAEKRKYTTDGDIFKGFSCVSSRKWMFIVLARMIYASVCLTRQEHRRKDTHSYASSSRKFNYYRTERQQWRGAAYMVVINSPNKNSSNYLSSEMLSHSRRFCVGAFIPCRLETVRATKHLKWRFFFTCWCVGISFGMAKIAMPKGYFTVSNNWCYSRRFCVFLVLIGLSVALLVRCKAAVIIKCFKSTSKWQKIKTRK